MFHQLSSLEIDAFYTYAEALYDGKIAPPGGVIIGPSLEETIRLMLNLFVLLGQKDHNSVQTVVTMMLAVDRRLIDSALTYIGRPSVH